MKKLVLALVSMGLFSTLYAQGPQIEVTIPITAKSTLGMLPSRYEGYLYLPQAYSSSQKYPVLFFFHGLPMATKSQILGTGLPQLISQGMRPDNISAPGNTQKFSFIVLSVWNGDPYAIPQMLSWLKKQYSIDESRVYTTGLSGGAGISLLSAVSEDSISAKIAACVPMSVPGFSNRMNADLLKQHKIHTWFLSGTTDAFTTNGAVRFHNMANQSYPNSSFLTLFSGGHCCWNTYYNTNYKDPVLGMNIYQWMLQYKKPDPVLPMKFKSAKLDRS